jgi:ornithine cyclodeaminase/alanine dehydrogenase-like protein (mu-crystallin family)
VSHALLLLDHDDVAALMVELDLVPVLRTALEAISSGNASAPPRSSAVGGAGKVSAMPGYIPGGPLITKLVSVFPANHALGLPSHRAVIAAFSADDGRPLALLEATGITASRTANVSAIATDLLAAPDAATLAVLGTGTQAQAHLRAFASLRPWREIRVCGRDQRHAHSLAATSAGTTVAESFEAAVRGADVIACCTSSPEPIVHRDWLAATAHVVSVGGGRELDGAIVAQARLFVEWRGAATFAPPAGAHELQGVDPSRLTELGELIGQRTERTGVGELTVFKSTGHAAEDAACARAILERAHALGRGRQIAL